MDALKIIGAEPSNPELQGLTLHNVEISYPPPGDLSWMFGDEPNTSTNEFTAFTAIVSDPEVFVSETSDSEASDSETPDSEFLEDEPPEIPQFPYSLLLTEGQFKALTHLHPTPIYGAYHSAWKLGNNISRKFSPRYAAEISHQLAKSQLYNMPECQYIIQSNSGPVNIGRLHTSFANGMREHAVFVQDGMRYFYLGECERKLPARRDEFDFGGPVGRYEDEWWYVLGGELVKYLVFHYIEAVKEAKKGMTKSVPLMDPLYW